MYGRGRVSIGRGIWVGGFVLELGRGLELERIGEGSICAGWRESCAGRGKLLYVSRTCFLSMFNKDNCITFIYT